METLPIKETLPDLIPCQQTAYVKNRFIGEGGRLISDILEISDVLNLRGHIATVDIEEVFHSLSHSFLLVCPKIFRFGHDFIRWVTILLESQEFCIFNARVTTSYFSLEKDARQGDPVSAYLFTLCLEVLFLLVKANHKIRGLNIFQYTYLCTALLSFRKIKTLLGNLIMETLSTFSQYSCLKPTIKNVKLQESES